MPNLEKLAQALDVEVKDLFDFEHEKSKEELHQEITNMLNNATDEQVQAVYRVIKCLIK
jgi:hypothetical protein